jgi:hypothetical protein
VALIPPERVDFPVPSTRSGRLDPEGHILRGDGPKPDWFGRHRFLWNGALDPYDNGPDLRQEQACELGERDPDPKNVLNF